MKLEVETKICYGGVVVAMAAGEHLVASRSSNLASASIMVASANPETKLSLTNKTRNSKVLRGYYLLPVIQFADVLRFPSRSGGVNFGHLVGCRR